MVAASSDVNAYAFVVEVGSWLETCSVGGRVKRAGSTAAVPIGAGQFHQAIKRRSVR